MEDLAIAFHIHMDRLLLGRLLLLGPLLYVVLHVALLRNAGDPVLILGRYSPRVAVLLATFAVLLTLATLFALSRYYRGFMLRELGGLKTALLGVWGVLLLPQVIPGPYLSQPFHTVYLVLGLFLAVSAQPFLQRMVRQLLTPAGGKALVLVLISCAMTLVVVEVLMRIWLYQIAPARELSQFFAKPGTSPQFMFVPHPYLSYALQPGYAPPDHPNRHNAQGYRGAVDITVPKPKGEYRIFVYGGSTTYGTGVGDWRGAYPAQLEEVLKARGYSNVTVVNAGVPGYASWESLIDFELRGLDYDPDMVLIHHGVNDVHARLVDPRDYRGDNTGTRKTWDTSGLALWPYQVPSVLVRFVAMRLQRMNPLSIDDVVWPEGVPGRVRHTEQYHRLGGLTPMEALRANPPVYFDRNVRSHVALAKAHGVVPVLVTPASAPDVASGAERYVAAPHYQFALEEETAVLRRISKDTGVMLIDLPAELPAGQRVWQRDGVHFTSQGGRVVADILANHIAPLLPKSR
jgi:lysophospholipase L1-like esterase